MWIKYQLGDVTTFICEIKSLISNNYDNLVWLFMQSNFSNVLQLLQNAVFYLVNTNK